MFYSDETIDSVRSASDIVDVVGEYVRLKRSGSNYFGLCPFHSENTASFSVHPEMGIFKCFGCGAGGDVFQFVMRIEGLEFPEALRSLAERAGLELPEEGEEERERVGQREGLFSALRFAARYYHHELTQAAEGKGALKYLRERRFSKRTIKTFGLGYAPDRWDGLLTAASGHHISEEVLEEAGLAIPRKGGSGRYDRFRGRIMFPILSHVGKVVGFGGRILSGDSDQPKYINSPETPVYNKSRVLYGLYQAKHAIRKKDEALLVEGYTDVIALNQAGIENAVASSGTSLTREQVHLLSRYAKRIVLVFDSDAAGTGAAMRGVQTALPEGLAVYVVALPEGEDPDSFSRSGAASVEGYLEEHRRDFLTYMHEQAEREGRLDSPEGEAEVMHEILEAIAAMPDALMQETYVRRASDVLRVPDVRLHSVLDDILQSRREKDNRRRSRPAPRTEPDRPVSISRSAGDGGVRPPLKVLPEEMTLLRLMFEHGSSLIEFILGNTSLDEFTSGAARETVEQFLDQYESGEVDRQAFLNGSFGDDVRDLMAEVAVVRHEPSKNWERKQRITVPRLDEDPYEAAISAMTLLKLDRVNDAIEKQREEIFEAVKAGDEIQPLQTQMMALHELRRRIERREFLEDE